LQGEYDLTLDWHGYELHPETPPGGIELSAKFGGKERVLAMQTRLLEFAKGFGIEEMKMRARSPNTRRALAIAEYARDRGKLERWRTLAMDAHWKRGLDLESDADLRALSAEAGLDPDAALAASRDPGFLSRIDRKRAEAEDLGVTGIPTFVIGERGVVGCQPYEVLARFVEAAGARKR
jgi:predicted DsbA family dithiol-disulfide isomerase